LAKFNDLYLQLCDGYKQISNTNSERDPLLKAEVPLISETGCIEPMHWVLDHYNTDVVVLINVTMMSLLVYAFWNNIRYLSGTVTYGHQRYWYIYLAI